MRLPYMQVAPSRTQDMRVGFGTHFHALIPRTDPQLSALTGKSLLWPCLHPGGAGFKGNNNAAAGL